MTESKLPFPTTTGRDRGYEKTSVDKFLKKARKAFELGDAGDIDARDVRTVAFKLVKGGYVVGAVDAALGRIEDAFAAREREKQITTHGADRWVDGARELAQEILNRLARPQRKRFGRARGLRYGYRIDEVDLVGDKLTKFFEHGEPVSVEQVRAVAFRMQRRGYREEQVDALLDSVVDVMLAVR